MDKKQKVQEIIKRLYKIYPHPKIALKFKNPYELLVATPEDLANAEISDIDQLIKNINFHSNKTKMIKGTAQMVIERFHGKVPDNMQDLDSLPGVARKTANVILGSAFGKSEGIVVDTHVIRLANKLNLTNSGDPVKIEQDLMEIVPKNEWINFPLMLIAHGRDICSARPHTCEGCPLGNLCPDMKG